MDLLIMAAVVIAHKLLLIRLARKYRKARSSLCLLYSLCLQHLLNLLYLLLYTYCASPSYHYCIYSFYCAYGLLHIKAKQGAVIVQKLSAKLAFPKFELLHVAMMSEGFTQAAYHTHYSDTLP